MSSASGFVIENGELKKYDGPGGHVIIPEDVTSIGNYAFKNSSLMRVTIPEGVASIGEGAFCYCNNLTRVTIPEGVTSIGYGAFCYCGSLMDVSISKSVTSIGISAFRGCNNLKSVTIPEGVTRIGDNAFSGCRSLTSVTIPDSVTNLGYRAFSECPLLSQENVKLPSCIDPAEAASVYRKIEVADENGCIIENNVLYRHCKKDNVISVPEGVVEIAYEAFQDNYCTRQIVLPDSVRLINENKVFQRIEEMNIPDGYLQQAKILPIGAIVALLKKAWARNATLLDYACLLIFQKGKTIIDICQKKLSENPDESVKMFLSIPQMNKKKASYGVAAEFLMRHVHSVSPENIRAFYNLAVAANATEAAEWVKPAVDAIASDTQSSQRKDDSNSEHAQDRLPDLNSEDFNISGDTLLAYLGSDNSVSVPFGVVEIAESGLCRNGKRFKSITLPDSVRNIHRNAFIVPIIARSSFEHVPPLRYQRMNGMPGSMNIPKGYFTQTRGAYDLDMAILLLCGPWKSEATFDDYAEICANQTNAALLDLCFERFSSKPPEALDKLLEKLEKIKTRDLHERTAHFALENINSISHEQLNRLLKASKRAGASTAVTLLEQYAPKEPSKQENAGATEYINPLEEKLRKKYNPYDLDMVLKRAKSMESYCEKCVFDEFDFSGVKYANSDEEASPFVLKYVIASYVEKLEARPKRGHMCCNKFGFSAEADKVAATFDAKSFQKLVDRIELCHETVAVKCRYGSEKEIVHIGAMINKGERDRKDTFHIVAIEAIVLSDTRRAMIIADEHDLLGRYARMRHTTAEVIRETKLLDFGFSDAYTKYYDIGSTLIQAKLNRDLSLSLYNVNEDKIVKALPKKGADPEKLQEATEDLSDLKKNIKKVISNRKKELFPMFLSGETIPVAKWKLSYISNPVFHRFAETIVWNQGKDSFIITESGAIRSDGSTYSIKDNAAIGLAHPLLMDDQETRAWQRYISSQGIKQPFIQMWEPTPARYEIKPDRYVGCLLPYYRFLHREEHGITTYDFNFHNDIEIELTDCNAKIERIDWHRHEISPDDRFEIKSIRLKSKYTLTGNHVIAYLDRITMYGRIMADDVTIADQLNSCNIAQITNYIQCAQEAKATNVLALLLDYKNKAFPDFDPMAEFELEW